ncbi:hypothetical protein AB0H36_15875 [Kribbella sp. NPDC050820]|uniref:hypothetical protein n=1 Tax=Kribbella sp. NPDC050820 TaxID=3155408 RepID=UPI0033DBDD95
MRDYPGVNPFERSMLREYYDSIEYGLDALRARRWALDGSKDSKTLADLHACINDISTRLLPRLEGLQDALIRAHQAAGGSVSHLANSLDKPRSTAQYRRELVLNSEPSMWEVWANGDLEEGQEYLEPLRADPKRSNGYISGKPYRQPLD